MQERRKGEELAGPAWSEGPVRTCKPRVRGRWALRTERLLSRFCDVLCL